ncbi:MAG: NAD/NADP octopine/nopaline dehydrogenase family protein [Candidatus Thorarchaeota archaeon]
MKIAVLGGGSAGQGIAGYLGLQGCTVSLYNRTPQRIESLIHSRTLEVRGVVEGSVELHTVSSTIQDVVEGAEYVLITARAFGHESCVRESLPYIQKNAILCVFTPYFAALRLRSLLQNAGRSDITLAETTLLPLAAQVTAPGEVTISGVKSKMRIAAFPASHTKRVFDSLRTVIPQLFPGKNVLETSLENYNPVFHVPIAHYNIREIEEHPHSFKFYHDGISPKIARVSDAVDAERMNCITRLGLPLLPAGQMVKDYYGVRGGSTYEIIRQWKAVESYVLPDPLSYVREEVLFGLVPLVFLCDHLDIPAHASNMLITSWSLLNQEDYWEKGITIEDLGLEDMNADEILAHVED